MMLMSVIHRGFACHAHKHVRLRMAHRFPSPAACPGRICAKLIMAGFVPTGLALGILIASRATNGRTFER
jgi:hypothetical protein